MRRELKSTPGSQSTKQEGRNEKGGDNRGEWRERNVISSDRRWQAKRITEDRT